MDRDAGFVHGPGISIDSSYSKSDARQLEALREQNQQLKDQVEHLTALLKARQDVSSGKDINRFAVQFYKFQLAQLQRQVVLLQTELRARNKLVREAESMLLECLTQIEPLVSLAPSSRGSKATSSSTKASSRAQQQQAAAEFDPAAWQQLCSWSQKMLGRLKRSRAEAAALLSKHTAGNGAGDWSSSGGKQRWDVDYVPAGGNRFLPEGCQLSIGQLCSGQGLAHADTSKVHQLEAQLVALAPQLAALAVALRATVLPALPWLAPEVASKLQVRTADVAQAAAGTAQSVMELCSLVPAGPAMFSRQVASMAASNVAAVQAGKQAEHWAELTDAGPGSDHAQVTAPADAAAEVADDLQDLDLLLAEISGCSKEKKAGGGSKALQPLLQQLRSVHCTALLKSSVLQSQLELLRRAVVYQSQSVTSLIQQTVQAVKRLVAQHSGSSSGRQAGSGQADGSSIQDGLSSQQRRQQQEQCHVAAAAMGEVLAAKDTLQQAPGEGSLRALVACLVGAGNRLQHVPELLVAAADRLGGGAAMLQQEAAAGSGREQLIEVLETVQQVYDTFIASSKALQQQYHQQEQRLAELQQQQQQQQQSRQQRASSGTRRASTSTSGGGAAAAPAGLLPWQEPAVLPQRGRDLPPEAPFQEAQQRHMYSSGHHGSDAGWSQELSRSSSHTAGAAAAQQVSSGAADMAQGRKPSSGRRARVSVDASASVWAGEDQPASVPQRRQPRGQSAGWASSSVEGSAPASAAEPAGRRTSSSRREEAAPVEQPSAEGLPRELEPQQQRRWKAAAAWDCSLEEPAAPAPAAARPGGKRSSSIAEQPQGVHHAGRQQQLQQPRQQPRDSSQEVSAAAAAAAAGAAEPSGRGSSSSKWDELPPELPEQHPPPSAPSAAAAPPPNQRQQRQAEPLLQHMQQRSQPRPLPQQAEPSDLQAAAADWQAAQKMQRRPHHEQQEQREHSQEPLPPRRRHQQQQQQEGADARHQHQHQQQGQPTVRAQPAASPSKLQAPWATQYDFEPLPAAASSKPAAGRRSAALHTTHSNDPPVAAAAASARPGSARSVGLAEDVVLLPQSSSRAPVPPAPAPAAVASSAAAARKPAAAGASAGAGASPAARTKQQGSTPAAGSKAGPARGTPSLHSILQQAQHIKATMPDVDSPAAFASGLTASNASARPVPRQGPAAAGAPASSKSINASRPLSSGMPRSSSTSRASLASPSKVVPAGAGLPGGSVAGSRRSASAARQRADRPDFVLGSREVKPERATVAMPDFS